MKEVGIGLGILLVVGVMGFAYRTIIEQPLETGAVCTTDAKMCPNGASVSRTGASCTFADCPAPNITIPAMNAVFVLPDGYSVIPNTETGTSTVFAITSATQDPSANTITIREYPFSDTEKDIAAVVLAHTKLEPADKNVDAVSQFTKETIEGKTYYTIVTERFEGLVASSYYVAREHDVLRFDVIDHNVQNWTDTALTVSTLPAHQALRTMLQTIQF